jgi:hypothetical protein
MTQHQSDQKRPNPIRERVEESIFTDREEELAFLMDWAGKVAKKWEWSLALISPRRYGKTAIMERFYNYLFWERDDVIPFYYELGEKKRQVREFARDYYLSFLRQFLAYRLRDATIAFDEDLGAEQLYQLAEEAGEELVQRSLENLPAHHSRYIDGVFDVAQTAPHRYASMTGLSIIVMFDEFQRLDQVLYFDEEWTRKCPRYTGSFATAVESSWAPMLIAGSQVTMLARRALGGAMAGRVGSVYVDLMPLDGGAELARKLARQQGFDLPLELAYTISRLTKAHPYYIWCLFHSRMPGRDLSTEGGVQAALTFEVEDPLGRINEFWRDHFQRNMAAINEVNAKKMVLFLARNPDRAYSTREIVETLGLDLGREEADERLRDLLWGGIVRPAPSYGYYYGLKDAMLSRVLLALYGPEMEDTSMEEVLAQVEEEIAADVLAAKDEMIAHLRGELSNWVGRVAEVFVEKVMKRCFEDQTVEGETYFHRPGPVKLSRFTRVHTVYAHPPGATRTYQVDLYGETETGEEPPWVVEVKNWERPVGRPEVERFLKAAENLQADRGHEQAVCWFYARSGFSEPAEALLRERQVLHTDQAGLVQLLRDLQVLDRW